jgi:hypothetical protein
MGPQTNAVLPAKRDRPVIAFFDYPDVFEDFYPHYGVDQRSFATQWASRCERRARCGVAAPLISISRTLARRFRNWHLKSAATRSSVAVGSFRRRYGGLAGRSLAHSRCAAAPDPSAVAAGSKNGLHSSPDLPGCQIGPAGQGRGRSLRERRPNVSARPGLAQARASAQPANLVLRNREASESPWQSRQRTPRCARR